MFPRNSYLPDEHLIDQQHNSYMGNKFHKSYDDHNPKDHPSYLGYGGDTDITDGDDGGQGDTSLHPEDSLVTHDSSSPYSPNTPHLGGGMPNGNNGSPDVLGAVHGDLCVEKRNGICGGEKYNNTYCYTLLQPRIRIECRFNKNSLL